MNFFTNSEMEQLRQIQNGDKNARHLMYKQYVRYLSAVCSRYINNDEEIKDVLQESFLRIFGSIGTFSYQGKGSLKAWMTRIVINESLKWLKKKHHLEFVEIEDERLGITEEEPDTEGVPSDVIYQLIRSLPDGYRAVFNLFVIEGKSHKEIAEILGIKESSSASQLHHAKAMLADKITQFRTRNNIDR